MVKLQREHGAPTRFDEVSSLVAYILSAVADGSRRPGSWERQMLEMMELVAEAGVRRSVVSRCRTRGR